MVAKVTESPAGKAGIVVVAVVAVLIAAFVGIRSTSGDSSQHADDREVKADAQKAIDVIKANPNISANLKAEMIAHQQGLMQGSNRGANTPPPTH